MGKEFQKNTLTTLFHFARIRSAFQPHVQIMMNYSLEIQCHAPIWKNKYVTPFCSLEFMDIAVHSVSSKFARIVQISQVFWVLNKKNYLHASRRSMSHEVLIVSLNSAYFQFDKSYFGELGLGFPWAWAATSAILGTGELIGWIVSSIPKIIINLVPL